MLLSTWNSKYVLKFSKYENDTLSLCETTNVFIDAYLLFQIHFHQLGPFKLIKTMLKSLIISSVESLSKEKSQYMSYLVQLSRMVN